jgi:hypothetical protein
MSRYGPPVFVTDQSGQLLAQALEQASSNVFGGIERGRERRAAREQQDVANSRFGWFRGTPPVDPAGPIAGDRAMADPAMQQSATSLMRSMHAVRPYSPGEHLADALPGDAAPAASPAQPSLPAPQLTPAAPAPPPPTTPGHPGAFDPSSGTFRNGQGLPAILGRAMRPDPYIRDVGGGYIDRRETPEAKAEATQLRGQALAREFDAQQKQKRVDDYVRAGYSPADAQIAVDNPMMADNIWSSAHPKAATPKAVTFTPHNFSVNGKAVMGFADSEGNLYDSQKNKIVGAAMPYVAPPSPEAQATRDAFLASRKDAALSRIEARLVQQYQASTHKYSQTADAIQAINENREGALRGDPIAQQTLLQDFIKLNLPGQIVTAGEIHNYAGLMGLGDKAGQLLNKLEKGSPLSQEQIQLILSHSDNLIKERQKGLNYIRNAYAERGKREGVDPQAFVDWFGFLPQETTTGLASPDSHESLSDADFTRAWNAGVRGDTEMVKWVKAHPVKR